MKRGKYKKWTNEEELVIISMRKEGKSIPEIAKKVGRPYTATQQHIVRMIGACKLEKKCISYHHQDWYLANKTPEVKPVAKKKNAKTKFTEEDCNKILQYVAETPWNIQSAFRRYSNESGIPVSAIHSLYYCRSKYRVRLKDRGARFTVVGSKGHTVDNCKNTNDGKTSNVWRFIKRCLLTSLLS